jgi:hypothetical protein
MPMIADEKKDDGLLYWEAGNSGVQLPEFKTRPKMIVFDKDVRTVLGFCVAGRRQQILTLYILSTYATYRAPLAMMLRLSNGGPTT